MHGFTTTLTAQSVDAALARSIDALQAGGSGLLRSGHAIGRDEIEPVVSLGGA